MKYYIVAGEASGDLHASNLMQGILDEDPDADFRYLGGDLMALKGGTLIRHYREMAFMGFWEVIKNLFQISRIFNHCKQDILDYSPDVVILVDYPGFNLRIAKFSKKAGFRVFYYIAPKVWAWNESRVKIISKYVDTLFVIFPFEVEYFKQHSIDALFFGNPLVEGISQPLSNSFSVYKDKYLSQKPIVALLSGSRVQEIKYNLPIMVRLASYFPNHQFVVAGAPSLDMAVYQPFIQNSNVKIVFGQTQELLKNSIAAVVTSGTATLEAALLDVPEVVCYRGNFFSMLVASMVIKVKYISLVNIIMGKEVVKELIQYKLTTPNLLVELKRLLYDDSYRNQMLTHFLELRSKLGGEGASSRIGKHIVETLQT